jgi:hypothetical protein
MRVVPAVVEEVASEVALQLVLDGDIRVSPLRVLAVERQVAYVMRLALLREAARLRLLRLGRELQDKGFDVKVRAYTRMLEGTRWSGRGFLGVVEAMVGLLRWSPAVQEVRASDDVLFRKILSVIARPPRKKLSSRGGGSGPTGAAPAGGLPAEVRAWEVARGETPADPDPERKERSPGVVRNFGSPRGQ